MSSILSVNLPYRGAGLIHPLVLDAVVIFATSEFEDDI
jgi:hypothetical protein